MLLNTKNFGDLEINEDLLIEFEEGIPGFDDKKRYALLQKDEGMFFWLQSVDDGNVAFPLLNTLEAIPEYNPNVNDEDLESIGGLDTESLLVFNIMVVPENVEETRVNLKAPLIIHSETKKGKQIVVNNEEYSIRHFIFKDSANGQPESAGEQ